MPKKLKTSPLPKTITCDHCRYERPEKDAHCHICGWPWPWAVKEAAKVKKGKQAKSVTR